MVLIVNSLLIFGFILAACPLGSASSSEHLPIAEALRKGCTSALDCDKNEYCGGRGPTKRCIECFQCSTVERKPRMKTYDGEGCATHQTDCGECNDGYKELGGVCVPNSGYYKPVHIPPFTPFNKISADFHQQPSENVIQEASFNGTVIIIFLVIGVVSGFIVGAIYYFRKHVTFSKSSDRRDEERTGLYTDSPTAPPAPDEYRIPPPAYTPFVSNMGESFISGVGYRRPTDSRLVRALPFSAGNGAGVWTVEDQLDPVEIDYGQDQNDGAQPNHQNTEASYDMPDSAHQSSNASGNEAAASGESNNAVNPHGNDSFQHHEESIPLSTITPSLPTTTAPQPSHSYDNDPVLGEGFIGYGFVVDFGRMFSLFQNTFPGTSSETRRTVSAPASPRRIDDTIYHHDMHDFLIRGGSFLPSRASLDSGTGTGDHHDRSVPSSRFVSGSDLHAEFSDVDMDDSMFDMEQSFPPPQHTFEQPPQVPDIAQVDEFRGEDMMILDEFEEFED